MSNEQIFGISQFFLDTRERISSMSVEEARTYYKKLSTVEVAVELRDVKGQLELCFPKSSKAKTTQGGQNLGQVLLQED